MTNNSSRRTWACLGGYQSAGPPRAEVVEDRDGLLMRLWPLGTDGKLDMQITLETFREIVAAGELAIKTATENKMAGISL